MTIQETFIASEAALTKVVKQIKPEQWDMAMPDSFRRRDNQPVTLRQIINYHAYDDAWVPDTLAGKSIEEVGTKYDGDLLGDDPVAAWDGIVAKAVAAVQQADLKATVHLTYGDWPAGEYLKRIISFRGLRAIDLARVLGVDDQLPEELAQSMYDLFLPDAEGWRKMGVFSAEIPVAEDAPIQQRLLGLTGRQPTV